MSITFNLNQIILQKNVKYIGMLKLLEEYTQNEKMFRKELYENIRNSKVKFIELQYEKKKKLKVNIKKLICQLNDDQNKIIQKINNNPTLIANIKNEMDVLQKQLEMKYNFEQNPIYKQLIFYFIPSPIIQIILSEYTTEFYCYKHSNIYWENGSCLCCNSININLVGDCIFFQEWGKWKYYYPNNFIGIHD